MESALINLIAYLMVNLLNVINLKATKLLRLRTMGLLDIF